MAQRRHPLAPVEEADLSTAVLAYLNSLPETKAIVITVTVYMEVGTPDILGSHHGTTLALELKRPGKKARRIQAVRLAQWRAAGAITGTITSVEGARQLLEEWRNEHDLSD